MFGNGWPSTSTASLRASSWQCATKTAKRRPRTTGKPNAMMLLGLCMFCLLAPARAGLVPCIGGAREHMRGDSVSPLHYTQDLSSSNLLPGVKEVWPWGIVCLISFLGQVFQALMSTVDCWGLMQAYFGHSPRNPLAARWVGQRRYRMPRARWKQRFHTRLKHGPQVVTHPALRRLRDDGKKFDVRSFVMAFLGRGTPPNAPRQCDGALNHMFRGGGSRATEHKRQERAANRSFGTGTSTAGQA